MKGQIQDESDDYVCRKFWLLNLSQKALGGSSLPDEPGQFGFPLSLFERRLAQMHWHILLKENLSGIL